MTQRLLFELYVSGPALNAFQQVCRQWNLDATETEQLLGASSRRPEKQDGSLDLDQVERISTVLKIFRLLGADRDIDHQLWLRQPRPDPIFAGRSALDLMLMANAEGLRQTAAFAEREREVRAS